MSEIEDLRIKVAALEAALRQALRQWRMYAEFEDRDLDKDNDNESQTWRNLQALTSSEGAKECPHGCVDGKIETRDPGCAFVDTIPCPLHGATSAAEKSDA